MSTSAKPFPLLDSIIDAVQAAVAGHVPAYSSLPVDVQRRIAMLAVTDGFGAVLRDGPGSAIDEHKAITRLRDFQPVCAPAATGLSHAMALLIRDARRWQALLKQGGRVRVLGSAKLGQPGYQHIGLELWTEYPLESGYDASDRKALTRYADAAAASPALVAEAAHA